MTGTLTKIGQHLWGVHRANGDVELQGCLDENILIDRDSVPKLVLWLVNNHPLAQAAMEQRSLTEK